MFLAVVLLGVGAFGVGALMAQGRLGDASKAGMAAAGMAAGGLAGGGSADAGLALVGATVYTSPSAAPILGGVVLVRDGKITAVGDARSVTIPKGMRVLDCKGLVLTAGFWNSHLHFIEPKWQHADSLPASVLKARLDEMINRYGFTHVFELATLDLKNVLALRARIEAGQVGGPAILVAAPMVPAGGNPFYVRPLRIPEIANAQEATAYVNEQIRSGADAIKIWSSSPIGNGVVKTMPMDMAKAVVVAAHRLGKPVFAHPSSDSGVAIAVESGVDMLAHTEPFDGVAWTPEITGNMLAHKVALTPTLKLWTYEIMRQHVPAADSLVIMAMALKQLGAYAKAGGEVLFGTDVGYMADYSPTLEYVLMSKAGLSFEAILGALTTAPAKRYGKAGETGRIAVGTVADLVVLAGDPKTDVKNFSEVVYTIRKGKIIYSRKN